MAALVNSNVTQWAQQWRKDRVDGKTHGSVPKKDGNYVKKFCKMSKDKKEQRDNKGEREFRKNHASCYYEELSNNLVLSCPSI